MVDLVVSSARITEPSENNATEQPKSSFVDESLGSFVLVPTLGRGRQLDLSRWCHHPRDIGSSRRFCTVRGLCVVITGFTTDVNVQVNQLDFVYEALAIVASIYDQGCSMDS